MTYALHICGTVGGRCLTCSYFRSCIGNRFFPQRVLDGKFYLRIVRGTGIACTDRLYVCSVSEATSSERLIFPASGIIGRISLISR